MEFSFFRITTSFIHLEDEMEMPQKVGKVQVVPIWWRPGVLMVQWYDHSPGMPETGARFPIEAQFFHIANCHEFNPMLQMVANVISEVEILVFCPWRGEYDSSQVSWWSSSMTLAWSARDQGLIPLLRHRIFSRSLMVTYSTHCYIKLCNGFENHNANIFSKMFFRIYLRCLL